MAEKRVLVRGMAERYRRSGKKEKGRLLDELVEVTGYNRSYATWLLNQQGRKIWVRRDLVVVGEIGVRKLRRRHRIYELLSPLCISIIN